MAKATRRDLREIAFSLVFEWGFREDETFEEVAEQAAMGREAKVVGFAGELARQTIAHSAELDGMIQRYSQKWKLNRIPKVTLALLRMSFCELTYFPDIPVGATINEGVELAKKYASEEDAAYLNGILGQFERDRTADAPTAQPTAEQPDEENMRELISEEAVRCGEAAEAEAAITSAEMEAEA